MKTTVEIPDGLFRAAKATAAREGRSLREFFAEALEEKLRQTESSGEAPPPPWRKYFGAFADSRQESARIQDAIDAEFGAVDPREEREP